MVTRGYGLSAVVTGLVLVLLLGGCGLESGPAGVVVRAGGADSGAQVAGEAEDRVRVRVFDGAGELVGPVEVDRVVRTEAEWRERLTEEQFRITRRSGTEAPFCGLLLDNDESGVYVCIGCDLPLFDSEHKYDSGTGWPSFSRSIAAENVGEREDRRYGMRRTEILCVRCDGHLGHVFGDGPAPTGRRYCVNSDAMRFVARDEIGTLADPAADRREGAENEPGAWEWATAVVAGGCFWCVEAVFLELDGVVRAVSGYAGGDAETANYRAVTSGRTDHAEAVQIVYDPSRISYEQLLRVHFETHDPTQLNRQGPDVGRHYRSAIFYADEAQKRVAEVMIASLNESGRYDAPIVTTLEPLDEFYKAEAYHQNFAAENPTHPYIRAWALPKLEKVRERFPEKVREEER